MNKISIRQLEVQTIIGVNENERIDPQPVWIDIEYMIDASEAVNSDQLKDTIDYANVCEKIKSYITKTKFQLIETLAENTAKYLMDEFSLSWLRLTITKKPSDLPEVDSVNIQIERENML